MEVWEEVRRLRLEIADEFDALEAEQWDAPSWCTGWRVRDVLGHLVHLAEATQRSMVRDVFGKGLLPDRALDRVARTLGDAPVAELTERLRRAASGRFHVVGSPPAVAMGELLVHGSDALRPAGVQGDRPLDDVLMVLDIYKRVGRLAFHSAPQRGLTLVATDARWQSGSGPEVRGRAIDLLMLVANRRQVLGLLEGSGLERINARAPR